MLDTATGNEPGLVITSCDLMTVNGTTVTPGNNTYGTYAQLISGSLVTDDVYGFWLCVNANAVSGAARDAIAKLGVDPAGGTSYTDLILHLGVACAGFLTSSVGGGGIWYWFPVGIKAGSSIALAVSVNNATVGTCLAYISLHCRPSRPELVRVGSFVRTFGATPATSTGTTVAPPNGSKGSYVQLGSSLADNLWYWNMGVGCNSNNMNINASFWDLAIGSSTTVNRNVIVDQMVMPGASETLSYVAQGAAAYGAVGDGVFVRAASVNAAPTNISAFAYGVGG